MRFIYLITLLLIPSVFYAQNVEFDKNLFKDQKSEFKAAVKSYEAGDALFNSTPFAQYAAALPFYEEANAFNPNNAMLNFKIGVCYLNSNQKFKALGYFEKSKSLDANSNEDINFYLGRSYQLVRQWDKAVSSYSTYIKTANPKTAGDRVGVASKKIAECNEGKKLEKSPVRVWIDNMGKNINSEYPEYGMIMNADATEIYFTSRRPSTTGGGKDDMSGGWYEDIYTSTRTKHEWSPAVNVGDPINTKGHECRWFKDDYIHR